MAGHDRLLTEMSALGRASGIASVRRMSGGYVADVWEVGYQDGTRVVGKTVTCAPAGLFRAEADSLAALRATGHVETPAVRTPISSGCGDIGSSRRGTSLGAMPDSPVTSPTCSWLRCGGKIHAVRSPRVTSSGSGCTSAATKT